MSIKVKKGNELITIPAIKIKNSNGDIVTPDVYYYSGSSWVKIT